MRSRRWSARADLAGEALDAANNARLIEALAGAADRAARYVCAAAYVDGDREVVVRGETEGVVRAVSAGRGGFGYDPYFESSELGGRLAS